MAKWKDKQAAVRALERKGKVDPNDLIEAARDRHHPCHSDFTWGVKEAAKERWRDQARAIIRKCRFDVVIEDVTNPVVEFLSSPDADENVFISVPKLRAKSRTMAAMLAELSMLVGLVARIRGVALAKQNIIGPNVATQLSVVFDLVEALRDEMNE